MPLSPPQHVIAPTPRLRGGRREARTGRRLRRSGARGRHSNPLQAEVVMWRGPTGAGTRTMLTSAPPPPPAPRPRGKLQLGAPGPGAGVPLGITPLPTARGVSSGDTARNCHLQNLQRPQLPGKSSRIGDWQGGYIPPVTGLFFCGCLPGTHLCGLLWVPFLTPVAHLPWFSKGEGEMSSWQAYTAHSCLPLPATKRTPSSDQRNCWVLGQHFIMRLVTGWHTGPNSLEISPEFIRSNQPLKV